MKELPKPVIITNQLKLIYHISTKNVQLSQITKRRECKPNCVNPPNIPKSLRIF